MSSEILRRAAAAMRARAKAADTLRPVPWVTAPDGDSLGIWSEPKGRLVGSGEYDSVTEHMASWHPAVALAVADWLDNAANRLAYADSPRPEFAHAEQIAHAYLADSAVRIAEALDAGVRQ